jgi:hypothetical protein
MFDIFFYFLAIKFFYLKFVEMGTKKSWHNWKGLFFENVFGI